MGCTQERAEKFGPPLAAACAFYGIDTPERMAAFLAQVGHESGSLRWVSEIWGPTPAQKRYEGRADLGNTQPGDGSRFRGHGLIQTTGRANHAKVRDRLRERFSDVPDFEANPEALMEPQWACLSAADYWGMKGLNALADQGNFELITRRINGGLNGYEDRKARWERAKKALSQEAPVAPFIAAALPAVIEAVPKLARMFSSGSETSERNIKAAEVVVGIAKDAVGARNEQELVEVLKTDPEAVKTVKEAVEAKWFDIQEVGGGIIEARKANAETASGGWKTFVFNPALLISGVLIPLVYIVVLKVLDGDFTSETKAMVIASVVSGVLGAVTGYWLGTSASSQRKTELLKP